MNYIRKSILPKFGEIGLYGSKEYSSNVYKRISTIQEEWSFEYLIEFFSNIKERLEINDEDINYLILVLESEIKLEKLIDVKKEKGYYDAEDIVLVRSTGFLPQNREIISISNIPFVTKMQSAIEFALNDYLKENNQTIKQIAEELSKIDERDHDKIEALAKEREKILSEISRKSDELSPFLTYYRSTIHFCLNGLVTNHSRGTFEGDFIIIEPFKHHVSDSSILSVRPEDTYFKDNIELSKDTVVLVDEKNKEDIESWVDKDKYNVVFYKGDKFIAVRMQLIKMGIVPEEVKEHNIADSKTSSMITDFIARNNYDTISHFNSEIKREDALKTDKLNRKYQIQFYSYLSDFISDQGLRGKLLFEINNEDINLFSLMPICEEIIKYLGIEKYAEIVNVYNEKIIENIAQGNYPTNEELLNDEKMTNKNI